MEKEKMVIFQINTVYNSGSTGRIVADLKHMLERNGNICYVAYGRGNCNEENTCRISNKRDLYMHALLTRITDKTGFYSVYATKKLIRKIKDTNPDIIHLHNIHGYYLHVGYLFRFLQDYGKPVVWTLHDCWSYTGHCVHYVQYDGYRMCDKWKSKCRKCERSAEYPKSWKDNSTWNYIHKRQYFTQIEKMDIVTVSRWLDQQVSESFLRKYSTHVIYNGVDLQKFKIKKNIDLKQKNDIGNKKVVLGVANVWTEAKGLNDFVELSKILNKNEYQIVLIGVSEKQMNRLPQEILGLPRTDNIEDLVDWYNIAEVYFNASKAETFGMTVIEALACGTPVVTYDVCAMKEILTDNCGFVIEEDKGMNAIAQCIVKCNKQRMEKNCIERSKLFEKNLQYEKYMELYRKILTEVEN